MNQNMIYTVINQKVNNVMKTLGKEERLKNNLKKVMRKYKRKLKKKNDAINVLVPEVLILYFLNLPLKYLKTSYFRSKYNSIFKNYQVLKHFNK